MFELYTGFTLFQVDKNFVVYIKEERCVWENLDKIVLSFFCVKTRVKMWIISQDKLFSL